MPRYAKKGTTIADIGQKMFEILVAARREYSFSELERESGIKLKCFDDIPADVAADHFWDYALHELGYSNTKARKDLEKIDFDFENAGKEFLEENLKSTLPDGTAFVWAWAGGDWEYPVRFVLYIDPKDELRAYIPDDGNVYCRKCKSAYGTCECEDGKVSEDAMSNDDLKPDFEKMYQAVCNRIEVK